jgi:EAL domain-containing protein (putative c-di-GMP-specific phosphodiesterase class I)/CheY-like chemotaxis protein
MRTIRVLVADDDPTVLELLSEAVRGGDGVELVARAEDAAEAIELTKAHRPDVAVLDVKMPEGGGARATREIRAACPGTRIVALSAFDDREAVLEMVRAGAAGYVVKGATVAEILEGIRRAARGEGTLSSRVTTEVIHQLSDRLEREADEADRRDRAVRRIQAVLERQELSVVLQPIFDLEKGRIVGAEALSRFAAEPQRGPDVWFAEAASVGLGVDLEFMAVDVALKQSRFLPRGAYLSLNLSPEAVTSGKLLEALGSFPPRRTVVEITEHAPVGDYEVLARSLAGFRSEGGRVAIDDAGAGFASLRHIVRLAPDIIKLDISLTRDIHADRTRRALAAALISFARETGTVIVAEGVEHREELLTLRQLQVDQAQGYHLSRPVAPAELTSIKGFGRPYGTSLGETA